MSRPDKRIHRERIVGTSKDESVRLFAFANTRPAYVVCFSPEAPIIILKSKRSSEQQHPCAQWKPFSDLVFTAQPNTTHAIYVADTTALSCKPGLEREEIVNGFALGRTLKQLSNVIAKLNPHNAIFVAAGASAQLALKYMLVGEKTLGHRDRLVEKLVLVCPSSLEELARLTDTVCRMTAACDPTYPKPSVVVLVKGGADIVSAYEAWLAACITANLISKTGSSVETDLTPSLFAAVARHAARTAAGVITDTVDTTQRYREPRVYRIDFVLSKASKVVEQFPVLSPLDTLGFDDDEMADRQDASDGSDDYGYPGEEEGNMESEHATGERVAVCGRAGGPSEKRATDSNAGHHDHDHHEHGDSCHSDSSCDGCARGEHDEQEQGEGSGMYVVGVSALQQWRDPVRIIVEGRVLDLHAGLIGTTEGCIIVEGLADLIKEDDALHVRIQSKQPGAVSVALATRIVRDGKGCTTMRALEVRGMTKREEKQSMTVGGAVGEVAQQYNVSHVAHSYGAVLVRGRKCALVRDLSEDASSGSHALRLPHQPLSDAAETGLECAIRVLCEACDVSSDNFYVPSYLPPTVYYVADGTDAAGSTRMRCVTLYTALAVCGPPRGPASDAREDLLDPQEPYDWVSFPAALALLTSEEERTALEEVRRALAKAASAGLYRTLAGCGVFGERASGSDAVIAAANSTIAVTAAAAVEGEAKTMQVNSNVELVAVLCPGEQKPFDALRDAVIRAFGAPSLLALEVGIGPEAAVAQASAMGAHAAAVFLNQDDTDVETFCEEHLSRLLKVHQVRSRLITVLSPVACERVADLRADTLDSRATLVSHVVSAALVSDLMWVPAVTPAGTSVAAAAETALWALLATCAAANPDLSFVSGDLTEGGAATQQRITPEEIQAKTTTATVKDPSAPPHGSSLRHVTVEVSEYEVPLAPAALAYLTRPSALNVFYKPGETFLMSVEGTVWVATRPATQGVLALDLGSRCLDVEAGEDWAAVAARRGSTIRLGILCAAGEATEAHVRAMASTMLQQLLWNKERDGADVTALKDPLPSWDE